MLAGRGDEDACVAILASYDKWLWGTALRIGRKLGLDHHLVEDLVQEGRIMIWRAARRFEIERGLKFITFFSTHVAGTLWRIAIEQRYVIRIPAAAKGNSAQIKAMKLCFKRLQSLDGIREANESFDVTQPEPEEHDNDIDAVWQAMGELPARWQDIMLRRSRGETLKEIGASYGISKERIRQNESKAVLRLRELCVAQ